MVDVADDDRMYLLSHRYPDSRHEFPGRTWRRAYNTP